MKKKVLSMLLAGIMVLSMAACGNNESQEVSKSSEVSQVSQEASSEASGEIAQEPSKEPEEIVPLKCYFLGNPITTDAFAPVLEQINAITREEISVELDITFIDAGSMQEKMNTIMGAGEEFDLMWTGYANKLDKAVANGAVMDITDMLSDYPGIAESVPDYALDYATIDGAVYAVPCMQTMGKGYGIVLQKSLVDKYNFDWESCTRIEDFEPFFEAVVKGETGITPFWTNDANAYFYDFHEKYAELTYCLVVKKDGSNEILSRYDTPEYVYYLELLKDYYDKGYIMQNISSYDRANKAADQAAGKFAAWITTYKPGVEVEESTKTGFECVAVRLQTPTLGSTSSFMSVSATSKKAEKALAMIELLHTNAELMDLFVFGIEGTHYNLNADGKVVRVENPTYDQYSFNWAFGNQFITTLMDSQPDNLWETTIKNNNDAELKYLAKYSIPSDVKESYSTEGTLYTAIIEEYGALSHNGVIDPAVWIPEFESRTDELLAEIIKKIQPSYDAFVETLK